MRPGNVRLLFDYGYHCNLQLLDQAEKLTDEQFAGSPPVGQHSVRKLFLHLASAEHGWRVGWQTGDRNTQLDPTDYVDIPSLRALVTHNNHASIAFLADMREADLDEDDFPGVALWKTLSHVVVHGIQHRSEIALILTHFGHSPGDLDLMLFVLDQDNILESKGIT